MRREEVVRARMAADAEQELAVQRAGDLEAARREARQKVDAKEMQEADMMERWRAVEAQKQARAFTDGTIKKLATPLTTPGPLDDVAGARGGGRQVPRRDGCAQGGREDW
jgi:hypothetical protein